MDNHEVKADWDTAATISDKLLNIGMELNVLALAARAFPNAPKGIDSLSKYTHHLYENWSEYANNLVPDGEES